jgi:hypothetical protein
LNEATITRLGSILECGNMRSHLDCRAAHSASAADIVMIDGVR